MNISFHIPQWLIYVVGTVGTVGILLFAALGIFFWWSFLRKF